MNPITDIALLKIRDDGPWPFAPLRDSSYLDAGTPCRFVGYPSDRNDRTPLVRETTIVTPEGAEFPELNTHKSHEAFGGDSGGGVFDHQGRLLAIHRGKDSWGREPGRHTRIETLRMQWDLLMSMNRSREKE